MIGVQVISGSEFWEFSKFVGFLIASASQVYYVCLYGSLLLDYVSISEQFKCFQLMTNLFNQRLTA